MVEINFLPATLSASYANAYDKHKIGKMFLSYQVFPNIDSSRMHRQWFLIQVNNFITSFKAQIQLKVLY